MTDNMMTLRTLLEKSSDADLLREMIGFTAQRLMALEMEGLTGAGHGERSPERINQRIACPGPDPGATATGCGRPAPPPRTTTRASPIPTRSWLIARPRVHSSIDPTPRSPGWFP